MSMIDLAQVDTALRQNIDFKEERFGSVLLGNPGTGDLLSRTMNECH
jgi:hypothetical protein